jgi:hypothetical protein
VVDNISISAESGGFVYYTKALFVGDQHATFLASNLQDPSIAGGAESIAIDKVPIQQFKNNTSYASDTGLIVRLHQRNSTHAQSSLVEDSTFWNTEVGVALPYAARMILKDLTIIRTADSMSSVGVDMNVDTADVVYENLTVAGYFIGIDVARSGYAIVNGGTFTTNTGINVGNGIEDGRTVTIQGPIVFNESPYNLSYSFEVVMQFGSYYAPTGLTRLFRTQEITLNYGAHQNRRLYFVEQHPDHVLYPEPEYLIPDEFIGLTAQEIKDQLGKTIAGELAPRNTVTTGKIHGLLEP